MKKYKIILILVLFLLILSCKKESESSTQKTPKELSDEARIIQAQREDSINNILLMKKELDSLRKLTEVKKVAVKKKSKPCKCSARTYRSVSHHSWVEFRLPKIKRGSVIRIPAGAYNNYVFPKCNRVYWSNLTFKCNPKSCRWERVNGDWDADAWCHGSKGNSPYVFTGNR